MFPRFLATKTIISQDGEQKPSCPRMENTTGREMDWWGAAVVTRDIYVSHMSFVWLLGIQVEMSSRLLDK